MFTHWPVLQIWQTGFYCANIAVYLYCYSDGIRCSRIISVFSSQVRAVYHLLICPQSGLQIISQLVPVKWSGWTSFLLGHATFLTRQTSIMSYRWKSTPSPLHVMFKYALERFLKMLMTMVTCYLFIWSCHIPHWWH